MAAAGAMADFARMPPQKKAMVFIGIGLLLGVVYWKLAYKDLDDRLAQAEATHDTKVALAKKLGADIPKFAELRTQMTKLHAQIEKNQTALPSEIELPAFFDSLQHKVNESGAEVRKWSYGNPEPIESFVRVPVEVEMTGTYLQIKRFFASLVQHDVRPAAGEDSGAEPERIVSIDNLALTNPTVTGREVVLNAKFTAVTYRQEDKSAEPVKPAPGQPGAGGAKPAAKPAAPPPPPPPPASSPPMPSAATPAGAKVRVENSLEKGDARNRNAVDEAKGSARLKGGL